MPLYDRFFDKYADLFSWFRPNAGPIGFARMHFSKDDMGFAEKALKENQILLLPGMIYDYPGFFRVGFGRKGIAEALAQFEVFVEKELIVT